MGHIRLALVAANLYAAVACARPLDGGVSENPPEWVNMVRGASGLYTSPSTLATVPEGAALVADNVVVDVPGEYTTRKGFARIPAALPGGVPVKAWTYFDGVVVAHDGTSLHRWDGSLWGTYAGNYPELDTRLDPYGEPTSQRMAFFHTQGSLFFTSASGTYRLEDAFSEPMLAGVPQALAGTVSLVGTSGFLPNNTGTAYRYVWGRRSQQDRLMLGAPSGRVVVTNTSGGSRNVSHVVPYPEGIDSSYFLQVYRADEQPSTVSPLDEMFLTREVSAADMDLTGTSYGFTDESPDTTKGEAAYFNPNTGGGIGAARYRPPLAGSASVFNGMAMYGNVEFKETLELYVLAVDAIAGLYEGAGLEIIYADGTSERYVGGAPDDNAGTFRVYTSGTPAQNIADTTNSLIRAINRYTGGRMYAYYLSDDNTAPGHFVIESRSIAEETVTVRAINAGLFFAPAMRAEIESQIEGRTDNLVMVSSSFPHGLVVGQTINLDRLTSGSVYPLGEKTVTSVLDEYTFLYADTGANSSVVVGAYFQTTTEDLTTDNGRMRGGFVASEPEQPDSVAATFATPIGDKEAPLLRWLQVGNTLFALKSDGLFRLSGTTPATLAVDTVDTTVQFVGADAALVVGGRAYALTTQGVVTWGETDKPRPASLPIESTLLDIVTQYRAAVDIAAFAVQDDAKRRAYFFLPTSGSGVGTSVVYVWNYVTNAWTRWLVPATTAFVHPDGRLWVAPPEDLGTGLAAAPLTERNTGTSADYYDAEGEAIVAEVRYCKDYGDVPEKEKHFNRTTYFFKTSAPTEVQAGFGSMLNPGPDWVTVYKDANASANQLKSLVPLNQRRGPWLELSVKHGQGGVPMRLTGYDVTYYSYDAVWY
jgi:hypothetical protein